MSDAKKKQEMPIFELAVYEACVHMKALGDIYTYIAARQALYENEQQALRQEIADLQAEQQLNDGTLEERHFVREYMQAGKTDGQETYETSPDSYAQRIKAAEEALIASQERYTGMVGAFNTLHNSVCAAIDAFREREPEPGFSQNERYAAEAITEMKEQREALRTLVHQDMALYRDRVKIENPAVEKEEFSALGIVLDTRNLAAGSAALATLAWGIYTFAMQKPESAIYSGLLVLAMSAVATLGYAFMPESVYERLEESEDGKNPWPITALAVLTLPTFLTQLVTGTILVGGARALDKILDIAQNGLNFAALEDKQAFVEETLRNYDLSKAHATLQAQDNGYPVEQDNQPAPEQENRRHRTR